MHLLHLCNGRLPATANPWRRGSCHQQRVRFAYRLSRAAHLASYAREPSGTCSAPGTGTTPAARGTGPMFGISHVERLAQPRGTVSAGGTEAPARLSAAKKHTSRVWHRAIATGVRSANTAAIFDYAASFVSMSVCTCRANCPRTRSRAAHLAVAADARLFAGPAAEPPRFGATLCVAQPRAERRARLNRKSVGRTKSRKARPGSPSHRCRPVSGSSHV